MQPLVVLTRSHIIESIHKGYISVVDFKGEQIYSTDKKDVKIYMRSSAKPIQAVAFASSGAMDAFHITPHELAIICSSHSGESFHRNAVNSILKKIGLSEKHLLCGVANPYNKNMLNNLIKKGQRPSPLFNCCSGKHAAMLALCKFFGYSIEDYTELEHPVQQLILKTISELLNIPQSDITVGVDGCGVPTIALPISQIAQLYALLAAGKNGDNKYRDALEKIANAMKANPLMINGDKEFCSDLIAGSNGRALGKVGAEGVYCIAVPEKQLGICIKISDGNERAVYPVATHLLSQLGILYGSTLENLNKWAFPPIKNHKGNLVGHTLPVFDMQDSTFGASLQIGDTLDLKEGKICFH
ncbi:MAG: L-asparaginase [Clostridia bacterium]|nr:L-asparaginase [Clostridia bacterium]